VAIALKGSLELQRNGDSILSEDTLEKATCRELLATILAFHAISLQTIAENLQDQPLTSLYELESISIKNALFERVTGILRSFKECLG